MYIDGYEELKNFNSSRIDKALTMKRSFIHELHPALNALETIAASFIIGLADQNVGYSIFGPSFCFEVYKVHDVIILFRQIQNFEKSMEMTVQLYKKWAPRYQQEYFPKGGHK